MKISRTDALAALTLPSLVSAAALAADWQYGTTATVVEFTVALAAGKLSFASFAKKWSPALSWGVLATGGAFLQATITGAFGFAPAVYAWLVSAALAGAARGVYQHHTRHDAIRGA